MPDVTRLNLIKVIKANRPEPEFLNLILLYISARRVAVHGPLILVVAAATIHAGRGTVSGELLWRVT